MKKIYGVKQQFLEEQKRLQACKTKEDLNNLFKGKQISIQNGTDWDNEICDFVEMVGEGERSNWKMKVRTKYGTFLELKGGECIVLVQRILTTEKEAEVIKNQIIDEFKNPK